MSEYSDPLWRAILGTAGTGKTYTVQRLAETRDDVLLCATTGIAAVNLGSTTINNLLWYYDSSSLQTAYEVGRLHAAFNLMADSGYRQFVIDEISMMDGRQLDILCLCLDELNGRRMARGADPMGLTLVGDFCQLPPVEAPFVFEQPSWARFAAHTTVLTEPKRQTDPAFLAALQHVRRGEAAAALEYFGPHIKAAEDRNFQGTAILAKNSEVDRYNAIRFLSTPGPSESWSSRREGQQASEWQHVPNTIDLKDGTLVMILANRRERIEGTPSHEWPLIYANGDLGWYHGKYDEHTACVELKRTGQDVEVQMVRRERSKITGARGVKVPRENLLGAIDYMPLRIAYASTCHKSQGLTLDSVQVMYHSIFWQSPGMFYTALSRARTLAGLRLVGTHKQFLSRCKPNPRVREFL